MATITFAIASAPLTGQKVFTSTDQDMQNILNWAKVVYDSLGQELFNPTWNTPAYAPINLSNLQVGVALSTGTMRGWQAAEKKYRDDSAHAAVPPAPPSNWS